jgi:hypothetical protein
MLIFYFFQKFVIADKYLIIILPIVLAFTIHLASTETFALIGNMATLSNIDAAIVYAIILIYNEVNK